MDFRQFIKNRIVLLDGGMGTALQSAGLAAGELPEEWNVKFPERVTAVHRAFIEMGSDVIYANTFGANPLKFGDRTEEIIVAGVSCARAATAGYGNKFVALDIGPCGKLLQPLGDLAFEDAVEIFKRTVRAGVVAGVDLIAVETMNDCYEMKAALLAVREITNLPLIATMAFDAGGKSMTGASPEVCVALAEALGADAVGVNCSLEPAQLKDIVGRMLAVASIPVVVKPNAGIPVERDGQTVYSLSAYDFARDMREFALAGARLVGGCCGSTAEYVSELKKACADVVPVPVTQKNLTVVTSYTRALTFGGDPVLIGERVNPTGKKRLKQALREGDIAYVLSEAVAQAERGAHALDVNVGLPEIDEPSVLEHCVREIQAVTDLPLQIDTSDPIAMERALRVYNGVALINSVNGTKESMEKFFPLAKKYGGAVICLTLDENGIPDDAAGRVEIARRIIRCAAEYGIPKNRLIFDPLATAVSAQPQSGVSSLKALEIIRKELGCNTSLGVSNISFGLPQRDFITSTYFTLALGAGLSAAIYNPYSQEMQKAYRSYMALTARDENCLKYVEYASSVTAGEIVLNSTAQKDEGERGLKYFVQKGLKAEAAASAEKLLETCAPLDIINCHIVPALDEVGKEFEEKKLFLPQLLMSAEAASAAFGVISQRLGPSQNAKPLKIVMATVKGDIHDIGKNIVVTLLKNYGFNVIDLGRDVPPAKVVQAVRESGAGLVGLSALMTTTVVSMKETVLLLRKECPQVKICVGGAVLTAEYAAAIGADMYCADAMSTVRYAEKLLRL